MRFFKGSLLSGNVGDRPSEAADSTTVRTMSAYAQYVNVFIHSLFTIDSTDGHLLARPRQ
jgi:hypothetical protein